MKTEREAFKAWVLKHPNNLNITSYEESIMFDAWQASASREGYKLVPVEMSRQKANEMSNKHWRDYQYSHEVYQQGQSATALSIESARINWCRNKAHEIMREYKTLIDAAS